MKFGFNKKKDLFPQAKHIIDHAFTCGGVDYYQFQDVFNLPYQRALQALVMYREISLNCTRDFLQAHVEAVRNCLTPTATKKVIDINSIYVLNEHLAQRLQIPPDTELLYKLASVVFFDAKEKPETYEVEYCTTKIDHWKKSTGMLDFFLQKPLQELIPFLKDHAESIDSFTRMGRKVNKLQLENLLASLSEEQKKIFSGKLSWLTAETPQS